VNDIEDIQSTVEDVKDLYDLINPTPQDSRSRLVRTINFSMWCVNASLTRALKNMREMEDYVSVGLAEADDLDEDDPLLRTRKIEHLYAAMKLASVIADYARVISQCWDDRDAACTLKELQFNYEKLTYIVAHFHKTGNNGRGLDDDGDGRLDDNDDDDDDDDNAAAAFDYGGDDEDDDDDDDDLLNEDHRPQLEAARAAMAAADNDCHRLIVDECLMEMSKGVLGRTFVYRRVGYLKRWKSRAISAGRYLMNKIQRL